jgi:hypothetical protein
MKAHLLSSKIVNNHNGIFVLRIGYKNYDFGFVIEKFGIRFMLIWWHCCIHLKQD